MDITLNDYKEIIESLSEVQQRQLGQWIADQMVGLEEKLRDLDILSSEEAQAAVQDVLTLLPRSPIIQPFLSIRRRRGVICRGPKSHQPKSEEIIDWLTKWIVNNVIIYFDTPKKKTMS